jgi:hypothetical protein
MSSESSIPPQCPKCNTNKDVIPIMYGLPDKKLIKMHDLGKIHHHGCEIGGDMPEWHCKSCGFEWGKIQI